MLAPGEGFPYSPLNEDQQKLIVAFCGGEPLETGYVRNFLQVSGIPALENDRTRTFFNGISWRSVNALDLGDVDTHEAMRASNRGMLFYAGILREISGMDVIPREEEVMEQIASADGLDFALTSSQRIRSEAPSFCAFAYELRRTMSAEDEKLFQTVLMGAGSVHFAVLESLALARQKEINELEDMFLAGD